MELESGILAGAGRQSEHLTGLGRRGYFTIQFVRDASGSLNQLRIALRFLPPLEVHVVFKANADVAAEKNREGRHRKLMRPNPRREPKGIVWHFPEQK